MQGNEIAAQLTPLATSTVELAAEDKFTLFAPADSAFAAAGDIPTGDELAQVHPSHACGYRSHVHDPPLAWGSFMHNCTIAMNIQYTVYREC